MDRYIIPSLSGNQEKTIHEAAMVAKVCAILYIKMGYCNKQFFGDEETLPFFLWLSMPIAYRHT